MCVRVDEHVSLSHSTSVLMYYNSIAMCVMLHTMYVMLQVYSSNDGIACALLYVYVRFYGHCCICDIAHIDIMLLYLCIACYAILHASCCIHEVAGVLAAVYVILHAYSQKDNFVCLPHVCCAIRLHVWRNTCGKQ